MAKASILLVEDTPVLAATYRGYLRGEDYSIRHAETGAEALRQLGISPPEVMLLDLQLPDIDGLEVLRFVRERQLPTETIVITAYGSTDIAVTAIRAGAFDFLSKPFDAGRLLVTVANAVSHQQLHNMVENFRASFDRERYHAFIGASLEMQAVYRTIESVASSKASIFITGESGTGKELCAAAIHAESNRREGPFIALNCGAIPRDLMESEIFGHLKGAFTGATANRDGAASRADGGTLFLDEVCEMDQELQTKLLRFVQTGSFQRVGGNRTETVDVRFLCATNRDPLAEVAAGRFREDLYYRLHVIPLELPPLRARGADVIAIARKFLLDYSAEEGKSFQRFAPAAEAVLLAYDWPGNVRQLQNVVRNIVVLNQGDVVTPRMLPPPLSGMVVEADPFRGTAAAAPGIKVAAAAQVETIAAIKPAWLVEKLAIEQAIALCDGNIPRAAALLELSPSTIYRKMQSWEKDRA